MSNKDEKDRFERLAEEHVNEVIREARAKVRKLLEKTGGKRCKYEICPLCGDHRLEHSPELWKKHLAKFRAEKRRIEKMRPSGVELENLIKEQYTLCPEFFENELNMLKIEDFRKVDIFKFDQYSFFRLINQGLFYDHNINRLLVREYLIRRRMEVASLPEDISRIKLENNLMSEFVAEKGLFLEYLQFAERRMQELAVDPNNEVDLERAIIETEAKSRKLLGLEGENKK